MIKSAKVTVSIAAAVSMVALACYSLQDRQAQVTARPYGDDGFSYSGMLRNGLFGGRGEILFSDGSRFSGEFLKGRANGSFAYASAGDWRFEGSFSGGKPEGTLYMPNSITINVLPEDNAEIASPKGWQYQGGIGERGQNGEGRYTFPGGESYTGGFLLGLADGYGIYKSADGRVIYEGQWKAGFYHGKGKYVAPGGAFAYEGAFEAGLPHGQAQYTERNTLRYDGEFEGGVPQGQGIYYSPEGWTYAGGFKNGVFHGKGTLTREGNALAGVWERGKQIRSEQ